MRGTLKKTEKGWVIEPIRTISIKGQPGVQYPLHPSQTAAFEYNVDWYEEMVDFDIKSEYVEPPAHIHSNRGADVTYAYITDETKCICEVGRPFNNITCPVHGVKESTEVFNQRKNKPNIDSLTQAIRTQKDGEEFMNQLSAITFTGQYCVRTPEGKFISIADYLKTDHFINEVWHKKETKK